MDRHASTQRKWTAHPLSDFPSILSSAGARGAATTVDMAGRPPRPPEPVREPPLGGAHVGSYRDLQVRPQPPTLPPTPPGRPPSAAAR